MASLAQMVFGKGISNLLIAEDLLKIIKDPFPFNSSPKSLANSRPWDGRITQEDIHFPSEMTSQTYHVDIKPLIVRLQHTPRWIKPTSL